MHAPIEHLPTGEQYEITVGDVTAVVTEQGATLRSLRLGDRELLWSFAADQMPQASQGQQLLPWPNRIRDGRYRFDDAEHQLPVNEVERFNALHGLVAWLPWRLVHHTENEVEQQVRVLPQPGYPFAVEATLTHRVDEHGLTVEVSARNVGAGVAPWGYAAHPYVQLGGGIDEWLITSPFTSYLDVTPDRLLPIGLLPVTGTDEELDGSPLGARTFDRAFAGPTGAWELDLRSDEARVVLWAGETLPWLQIYTPDDRRSLAVEPMSCGPDAFNEGPTHAGLVRLEPGAEWQGSWGFRVR
ncbi:aldose 1-epimerase family protein [Aestuariimicrobium soli]|uniref:aldose 1-epimerase family protein n=1 Tax=Aestuariimicrobium soli TaxID=2035834 RepID=UPI003EBEBFA2